MIKFKTIRYQRMLIDTLGPDWSFDINGNLTWYYKYCLACLQPLVQPFTDFDTFRQKQWLIGQCNYIIGQLTHLLNHFFDPTLKRITISRSTTNQPSIDDWAYPAKTQLSGGWQDPAKAQARSFTDKPASTISIISVPVGVDVGQVTAIVEELVLAGLKYQIKVV